jgi:hypothetical protein
MRNFFLLCFAVLLGSCTQYQYIILNSNIYHQDQQSFVWENDTVSIRYVFSGYNGPLTVQVYNKTSQPLYVDWKKSAIVYGDGSRLTLWNDQVNVSSYTVGGAVNIGHVTVGSAQTTGVVDKREQISFIPPKAYVSVRPLAIMSNFIKPLPVGLKKRVSFGDVNDTKVDKYSFTQDNTPFTFRCFLTLSVTDNFSRSIYIDQPFWVSDIMQTTISPASVLSADNMFYVSRTTTMGHIMGGVGTVAVVAGAVYLEAATEPGTPPPSHHGHRR